MASLFDDDVYVHDSPRRAFVQNNDMHKGRVDGARPKIRGTVHPRGRGLYHRGSNAHSTGDDVRRPQGTDRGRRAQHPSRGRGRPIRAYGHRDGDRRRTNEEHWEYNDTHEGARPKTRGTVHLRGRGLHHCGSNANSTETDVRRPQGTDRGRRAQHPSGGRGRPIRAYGHRDDDRKRTNDEHGDKLSEQLRGRPRRGSAPTSSRPRQSEKRSSSTHMSSDASNSDKGNGVSSKQTTDRRRLRLNTQEGKAPASTNKRRCDTRKEGRGDDQVPLTSPSKPQAKRKTTTPPIPETELQSLLEEDPSDILETFVKRKDEFLALLGQDNFTDDAFMLTLRILSCICSLDSVVAVKQDLNIALSMVDTCCFLSKHMPRYLLGLTTKQPQSEDGNSNETLAFDVDMVLKVVSVFLKHKPSACGETTAVLILVGKIVTSAASNDEGFDPEGVLMKQVQDLNESFTHLEMAQQTARQMARERKPPNNFRYIPIFPDSSEIRTPTKPFLRKNIIKGRYQDVEHYLDVQFRLLREDFVAPLREGVTEYLCDTKQRLQDIRIYRDAKIIDNGKLTNSGFVYTLQFDVSGLQRVRWESSKRLIYGSFICLTKDKFQHILCATIENRDIKGLQEGKVEIRFLTDIGNTAPRASFLMAETSAYFEACRHVLQGLQQMTANTFPFKKFIIEVSSNIDPPAYLGGDEYISYDLKSLVTSRRSYLRLTELTAQRRAGGVPILQPMKWPSAENLHLDESQKAALQAALTKEFAIIQGPPGTGKTYIGLKIVQILLHNRPWTQSSPRSHDSESSSSDEDEDQTGINSPILVVCYTNHALDQFLEGIIAFGESKVIRVGGRSSSEVLKSKNLSQLRLKPHRRRQKTVRVGDLKRELRKAEENVKSTFLKIDLAKTVILNFDELSSCLSRENERDLIMPWIRGENRFDPTTNLLWWLNVVDSTIDNPTQSYTNYSGQTQRTAKRIHVEDEGYRIQLERRIDLRGHPHESRQTQEDELFKSIAAYDSKCIKRCGKNQCSTPEAELRKQDCMTDEEVNGVKSIWPLKIWDRWRLYRFWTKRYIEEHEGKLDEYRQEYEQLSKQMQSVNDQDDALLLEEVNVVGMTTTGAAKCRSVLQLLSPRIVIVEEAAEVLEAHIITSLTAKCQHLILIGDHQQLKPNPTVYRLAKVFNLDTSLFERMINNGVPCQTLTHQHRMRPEISQLMKTHFYENLHDDDSVMGFDDIKGVAHNMFFIDHNNFEDEADDNKTKSNQYEAEVLVELCRYLLHQGYEPTQITILTTYLGQLFVFKNLMDENTFEGVRVSVVDNFQGEENDIILLSLVRSNEEGSIGFLKTSNRVCVALSRARMGFYCIGNGSILKKSQIWKDIIGTLEAENRIGSTLRLVCQNHPDKVAEVASADDFKAKVPQGGCGRLCEYRLPCGHACELLCHPYDRDHKKFKCKKQCLKHCDRADHPCPKRCFNDCGLCQVKVMKRIPDCGHKIDVYCYKFDSATCTMPCSETLKCGHSCGNYCSQPCTMSCRIQVLKILPCGHSLSMECCKDPLEAVCRRHVKKVLPICKHELFMECHKRPSHYECSEPCENILECGHKCQQRCGNVCQENLNVHSMKVKIQCEFLDSFSSFCLETCKNILPCGHPCPNKCGEPCATPEIDELYSRLHKDKRRLPKTRIATRCAEQVHRSLPNCEHSADMLCFEDVHSVLCQAACTNLLACGHPCTNRCHQRCSRCNKKVQKTLPCGHVAQVPCSQNVHHFKCDKKCKEVLACGHQCPNQCCDPCPRPGSHHQFVRRGKTCTNISARCEVSVQKALPHCHHTVTVQCFKDTKSMRCVETCNKPLACKHPCSNKCGAPCKCKQKVWKRFRTCKHSLKLPCDRDINTIKCRKC